MFKNHHVILYCIALVPAGIIMGNLLPPIAMGLKIHWVLNGLIVLLMLLVNIERGLLFAAYGIIVFFGTRLFVGDNMAIDDFMNYIAGPLFILYLINLRMTPAIRRTLHKSITIFLILCSIPMTIAVLQFLGVVPHNILYFDHINVGIGFLGDHRIRPNGFLYHPSELSIILINFIYIYYIRYRHLAGSIVVVNVVSYVLFLKSPMINAWISSLFLLMYRYQNKLLRFITPFYVSTFAIAVTGIYIIIIFYDFRNLGFTFENDFLTGRGGIWNTYLYAISNLQVFQYLFGNFYNYMHIFYDYSHIFNWHRGGSHPHNQFLDIFFQGGILGLALYIYAFYRLIGFIRTRVRGYRIYLYFTIFLPMFTIGITTPMMDRFVYWCGIFFLVAACMIQQGKNTGAAR